MKEEHMPEPLSAPLSVVEAWQEAANRQDAARLLELSAPNIEVVGPRGSGFGRQLLLEWLGRAGLSLTTLRAFVRHDAVVLEQQAVWHAVDTGEVTGEMVLASAFRVDSQNQVARVARCDTLGEALATTGLDVADEVN
jgi:Domain of unknown function (DUF4440)